MPKMDVCLQSIPNVYVSSDSFARLPVACSDMDDDEEHYFYVQNNGGDDLKFIPSSKYRSTFVSSPSASVKPFDGRLIGSKLTEKSSKISRSDLHLQPNIYVETRSPSLPPAPGSRFPEGSSWPGVVPTKTLSKPRARSHSTDLERTCYLCGEGSSTLENRQPSDEKSVCIIDRPCSCQKSRTHRAQWKRLVPGILSILARCLCCGSVRSSRKTRRKSSDLDVDH